MFNDVQCIHCQYCQESQFGEVFILGMPFLRYYFTVFDRANKQVGTLLRYAVLYRAVASISFSPSVVARYISPDPPRTARHSLSTALLYLAIAIRVRLESHHSNPSLLPCIVWKFSWNPFCNCLKYTENNIL